MKQDIKHGFLDLFAGAGGLSEGFIKAGFYPIAFVEKDYNSILSLKTRLAFEYLFKNRKETLYFDYLRGKISRNEFYSKIPDEILAKAINEEIKDENVFHLMKEIDKMVHKKIDIIIGGPPCQAYSVIGRSRMKDKVKNDKRNYLFKYYNEFLKHYKPSIFIFENVPGLLTAGNGKYFDEMLESFNKSGYSINYKILNASDYGVLQNRKRVFIIGVRGKNKFAFPEPEIIVNNYKLKDLFVDLPKLRNGEKITIANYVNEGSEYVKRFGIRNNFPYITQHITRKINDNDIIIYRMAIEKYLTNKKQMKYNEIPRELQKHNNKESFLDRFKVLNIEGYSHAIVSHLSKDGHYYIYPDLSNPRSISVREAARIQSFPDDYFFEGSMSSAFKQIGNAVPPLLAFLLAKKIKEEFL